MMRWHLQDRPSSWKYKWCVLIQLREERMHVVLSSVRRGGALDVGFEWSWGEFSGDENRWSGDFWLLGHYWNDLQFDEAVNSREYSRETEMRGFDEMSSRKTGFSLRKRQTSYQMVFIFVCIRNNNRKHGIYGKLRRDRRNLGPKNWENWPISCLDVE